MSYKHLTENERYQIAAPKHKGCLQREIAEIVQRSRATISRELRRNKGQKGYRPKQAQEFATIRCGRANKQNVRHVLPETFLVADAMLREQHSPERNRSAERHIVLTKVAKFDLNLA